MHDTGRWVRLPTAWSADTDVRWVITGNAHTHRGHFSVSVPGTDLGATVNLGDVEEISPEAQSWLDGFLAGQEAGRWEFFGESLDLYEQAASDPGAMLRWQAWNALFRERGFMPPLQRMPPAAPQLSELGDPTPWVHVGGRYRVWEGGQWRFADPQPSDVLEDSWAWPGSVCEQRRHCDRTDHGAFLACDDCHHIS